jgi:osmoprotectant transport system permease protein
MMTLNLFDLISQAWRYIMHHPAAFAEALRVHLYLSLTAIGMTAVVAIPLGFLCTRYRWLSGTVPGIFSAVRVIPGLAILAFMIPILGTGTRPAIFALILLAFPSILLNTLAGFQKSNADMLEAAQGMGMSHCDIFFKVEFPLAAFSIVNGLRIAFVEVISGATLAAFIGGGGLGTFIVNGLSLYNLPLLLVGALPVALMAILAELLFGAFTRLTMRAQLC